MDDKALDTLHDELYRLMCSFKRVCEENNLTYYLYWGTLIGAVRHSGFIPWDDDVDIVMPREDYERFINLFQDKEYDDWFLDNYRCRSFESMSPLLRINSKRIGIRRDRGNREEYISAFVGIFPLDGLPTEERRRDRQIRKVMLRYGILRASRSSLHGMGSINDRTKFASFLGKLSGTLQVGKIIPPRKAAALVDNCMKQYSLAGSKYCHIIDYTGYKAFFETDTFLPSVRMKFYDEYFNVPENYDALLREYYGNYMQLPPVEERVPKHGIEIKRL